MPISILGAGNVGMALAKALVRKGETVRFGVPQPDKYRAVVDALEPLAVVGRTEDAIARGDLVILAIPYGAAAGIARSLADWRGKILVDATNPLAPGLAGLSVGTTTSGAEEIAREAHGARVVKAFNTTGPRTWRARPTRAAPSSCRFAATTRRLEPASWRSPRCWGSTPSTAVDLPRQGYLEPFAMTWIHLAIKLGHGRRFAFSRLKR
jgi:predicted dinucleotide-binding enzyme